MSNQKNYYLGLDIGTDSVGYAVTDRNYNLLKLHGEPAWGVTVFDEASLNDKRRSFRTARRRLDRRQQRVLLIQELFASEISKIDPRFFIRIKESSLYRSDVEDKYSLFVDPGYSDKEYYLQYPTIHHLIHELMTSSEPYDVRLVYLACAWLVAHRGHFLCNIDIEHLSDIKEFDSVYEEFITYFRDNGYEDPWTATDVKAFGDILKKKQTITNKNRELAGLLYGGKKPSKEASEEFPFSREAIVRLLAGSTVKLKDIFCCAEYDEFGSVALGMDEDKLSEIMANIGDDYDLIDAARKLYDWAVLVDVLGNSNTISEAKIKVYEQHREDLKLLKYLARKYLGKKGYNNIFRTVDKDNYAAYAYHSAVKLEKKYNEDFSKFIAGAFKNVTPDECDAEAFGGMMERLELRTFMPKQKTTDNRVIPHQLYLYELKCLLEKAEGYLPFLSEKDDSGLTVGEKLLSVFKFRIPYFVGPLNSSSPHAWIERKEGKIYPWNFEKMVDLDASEQNFIQKMTNTCTYLPGKPVLPKDSLLYHKYTVLNEINNIRINGERIPVELKQRIYNELFMNKKKVTRKNLTDFLLSNGELEKGNEDALTGIDININSNLASQIAFKKLFAYGIITEADAEKIIERASYAEDKSRLSKWLEKKYPQISEADRKYIASLKLKNFGRLSAKLLDGIEGVQKDTGEITTVIGAMWNTQNNLMEIVADADRYSFSEVIEQLRSEYYDDKSPTLEYRLDEMYISNAVRRPIYRTLDIIGDVTKAFGKPEKVFVEMTRGATEDQKGKRTKTRKEQILELYALCKEEDVRYLKQHLEAMGEYADNKLQGDKLFLYYMQLGKSMYSGKTIDLDQLATKNYDIDHIYPQAYVKDDSIINNKVLVLSEENGAKSDTYPISQDIRHTMKGYWEYLKRIGLISEEKYKRLTRATRFTDEEKYGFINRQLTETSQSTKAVAALLKEKFPEAEIVYCKARLVSEFRQEFNLYKSRTFNDLHHAVDAYLNIITGNVYNMKFTKNFNVHSKYSIKTRTLFTQPLVCGGTTVWDGEEMLAKVRKTSVKNNAHFTKYAFFKKGGLFDQQPVSAGEDLTPLKKNLPTEKYGGYNKAGAMFYIPVKYKAGKKSEVLIMSVELLHGNHFLADEVFAKEYSFTRLNFILGKPVDEASFPMGLRPWKVNTVLSLDGFRVCIAGIGSKGRCLVAQPFMQFSANSFWIYYIKKLEMFVDKTGKNANYKYDVEFDNVSVEKNLELYDLYLDKLQYSVYSKRVNAPTSILLSGRDVFSKLDIKEQSKALLNIHQVFGRIAGGCDLTAIGGAGKAAATVSFSSTVSNWKKVYKDVRIVDSSASGLWEKKSDNLLKLL